MSKRIKCAGKAYILITPLTRRINEPQEQDREIQAQARTIRQRRNPLPLGSHSDHRERSTEKETGRESHYITLSIWHVDRYASLVSLVCSAIPRHTPQFSGIYYPFV